MGFVDPTTAKEFRLPSGEVMWIDPAAVESAKSQGASDMASKAVKVGDANDLVEAPQDGVYVIGRGHFRYKRGDKMPPGATLLEKPKAEAKSKGRGGKPAAESGPAPSENGQSSGPDETA
jgi:hypothetical protein